MHNFLYNIGGISSSPLLLFMSKFMQISITSFSKKFTVVINFTQSFPLHPSINFVDFVYTEEKKIENSSDLPLPVSSETDS